MDPDADLTPARVALTACRGALATLEASCCQPERSPRMKALGSTLDDIEAGLRRTAVDPAQVGAVSDLLEAAGAQVGTLQVACCATNRLPLYTQMLGDLTSARLTLDKVFRRSH